MKVLIIDVDQLIITWGLEPKPLPDWVTEGFTTPGKGDSVWSDGKLDLRCIQTRQDLVGQPEVQVFTCIFCLSMCQYSIAQQSQLV